MGRTVRLAAALLLLLLAAGGLLVHFRLVPIARSMIALRLDNRASNLINDAVDAVLESGDFPYQRLVTLERDQTGAVTALTTDMAQANRLKSLILRQLGDRVVELTAEQISVPVGNVVLPSLLSGRGGWVPVGMVTIQSSNAELHNRFSQAGWNQTLHEITLDVNVQITVLAPGGELSIPVRSEIPVAQTVIVGTVPQTLITPGED